MDLAPHLDEHSCPPEQIESVSIDMSPAFIRGCAEHLPNARVTFDKFHVVGHASTTVDKMRRIEQRTDKSLKGMRWSLLKDRSRLTPEAAADLDALIAKMTTVRTARAWTYKEQLREILETRQTNGFLGAINGLFQAAKRRPRGFTRLSTIRTVIFLIAGQLGFHAVNPHARQPN
jgi:transposase